MNFLKFRDEKKKKKLLIKFREQNSIFTFFFYFKLWTSVFYKWTSGMYFAFLFFSFFPFFFIHYRILLYPNLSVYMCEAPSWRFEPLTLPPTLYKHLYLWSDHRTKGVWWYVFCFSNPALCVFIFCLFFFFFFFWANFFVFSIWEIIKPDWSNLNAQEIYKSSVRAWLESLS